MKLSVDLMVNHANSDIIVAPINHYDSILKKLEFASLTSTSQIKTGSIKVFVECLSINATPYFCILKHLFPVPTSSPFYIQVNGLEMCIMQHYTQDLCDLQPD